MILPELYSGAYEGDFSTEIFSSNIYAFASENKFISDTYMGFSIKPSNNIFLSSSIELGRRTGNLNLNFSHLYEKSIPIFCYGGSVMFGSYAVSDFKTIPGFIAQQGPKFNDIFNFALPGSIIQQNFSHFFNKVIPKTRLNKFFLVILFGFNEYLTIFKQNLKYPESQINVIQSLPLGVNYKKLIMRSKSIVKFHKEKQSINPINECKLLITSIKNISSFLECTNGELLLFLQPNLALSKKKLYGIEKLAKNDSVAVDLETLRTSMYNDSELRHKIIDLTEIFDGINRQVFIDSVHLGSYGNRVIAEKIHQIIATKI
jgi:hypothetical protein